MLCPLNSDCLNHPQYKLFSVDRPTFQYGGVVYELPVCLLAIGGHPADLIRARRDDPHDHLSRGEPPKSCGTPEGNINVLSFKRHL